MIKEDGVYCTSCGTKMLYESEDAFDGEGFECPNCYEWYPMEIIYKQNEMFKYSPYYDYTDGVCLCSISGKECVYNKWSNRSCLTNCIVYSDYETNLFVNDANSLIGGSTQVMLNQLDMMTKMVNTIGSNQDYRIDHMADIDIDVAKTVTDAHSILNMLKERK